MRIFYFLFLLFVVVQQPSLNACQSIKMGFKNDPCPDHDEVRKVVEKETVTVVVEKKVEPAKKPPKKVIKKKAAKKPKKKRCHPVCASCCKCEHACKGTSNNCCKCENSCKEANKNCCKAPPKKGLYVHPGHSDNLGLAADGVGATEQWEAIETPKQIIEEAAKKKKAKGYQKKVAAEHDQEFAEIKDNNETDVNIQRSVNLPKFPKPKKEKK